MPVTEVLLATGEGRAELRAEKLLITGPDGTAEVALSANQLQQLRPSAHGADGPPTEVERKLLVPHSRRASTSTASTEPGFGRATFSSPRKRAFASGRRGAGGA